VLTKGEAEAKALAMRADAYKQFNEAAIIQTVLAALPDIVRAAAEPMGHINSLTVMSADGASDIVRNATRAMIESTTAIKGLTGLDVPNLIGGALGRGFGERLRTGEGDGSGGIEKAAAHVRSMAEEAEAKVAEEEEAAKEEVADAKAKAAAAVSSAEAASIQAAATATGAVKQAGSSGQKAAQAAPAKAAAAVAKVMPSDGNIAQWVKWLAGQLRYVPDIQVYGALRLADLADRGPAPARAIWKTAEAVLGKDYGNMTIADLLKRFEQ